MAEMAQYIQPRGRKKNDDCGKQAPEGGDKRQLESALAFQGMDAVKQMTQAWPCLGGADHVSSWFGKMKNQTLFVEWK
jgi:uncharacterized protein YidB (DUF937 family)